MKIKTFQPQDHYVRCTIYGASWVGKTVFAGTAPDALFASSEQWLLSIVSTLWYNPNYVDITSIEDMQELYKYLKAGNHGYKTLVIDSLSEINEMIKDGIEKKSGREMQIKERWELFRKIKWIMRGIKDLPMHVIVICQEKINNDWDAVLNRMPMLNGKNATEIAYMMDIVAYMYIDKNWERHITTSPSDKIVSKDRTGKIGRDASLNFNDWVSAVASLKVAPNMTPIKESDMVKTEYVQKLADEETADPTTASETPKQKLMSDEEFELLLDTLPGAYKNPQEVVDWLTIADSYVLTQQHKMKIAGKFKAEKSTEKNEKKKNATDMVVDDITREGETQS